MLQPWVPMSNTPTAMVLIHNMSNFLSVFWASIFHCFLMRFHHISLLFNAKSITEVKWQRTEQIEKEREEGWDGRQSAMKDMAAAVIFSYQFSEAVIRNISLKIRRKKKKSWCSIKPFKSLKVRGKTNLYVLLCMLPLSLTHTSVHTHSILYRLWVPGFQRIHQADLRWPLQKVSPPHFLQGVADRWINYVHVPTGRSLNMQRSPSKVY